MTEITWPSPYGYTIFCDDVREEVSSKLTFVGVYGSEMSVIGVAPAQVAKLCLHVHYFEDPQDWQTPLELRVSLPGDPDDAPSHRVSIPARPEPPAELQAESRAAIMMTVRFAPLVVVADGRIKVRMRRGDDIVRLGSMGVRLVTPEEASAQGLVGT